MFLWLQAGTPGPEAAGPGAAGKCGALCRVLDLDGKLLFNVVEPLLKKHYDNMDRKDTLKSPYDMDKYPSYEYQV